MSSMVSQRRDSAFTGSPHARSASSSSHCVPMPVPARGGHAVCKEKEGPRGGDARVELLERAVGGVARVGVELLPRLGLAGVERVEVAGAHVHFAAHAQCLRDGGAVVAQPQRDWRGMVRTFSVTSSPLVPSPRVEPWTRVPFSYTSSTATRPSWARTRSPSRRAPPPRERAVPSTRASPPRPWRCPARAWAARA